MKILMINKFLYPKGGSETYIFSLGKALEKLGHDVQYFGMDHPQRTLGNRVGAYVPAMDLRRGRINDALRVLYSPEARRKLRLVLEDFQPDVCHVNNFNYQLTPSILLEICRWRKKRGRRCPIVYTAHDYQLVCPNHMCRSPKGNCDACVSGRVWHCARNRCIHDSRAKSILGAVEAALWRTLGGYRNIDRIICCSAFLKEKLDYHPHLRGKTVVLPNFLPGKREKRVGAGEYVLYFGRFSTEKGLTTLMEAAKRLPQIPFAFAGSGEVIPWELPNVCNVGFRQGEELKALIRNARFAVCPSQWYENCPFSILESLQMGVPVLGADIGGIPELIRPGENGDLFESGNVEALTEKLQKLWKSPVVCDNTGLQTAEEYAMELLEGVYGRQ